jgi:hypothetical protein
MCGAVRFSARLTTLTCGVCHCEMCRRWTGSALVSVFVPVGNVAWQGEDAITLIQSSPWAERAFCNRCGSGLYYHVTAENEHAANLTLPIGIFDDPDGFHMRREIYIDEKPDTFAYAGTGRTLMTRQQCIDEFGV